MEHCLRPQDVAQARTLGSISSQSTHSRGHLGDLAKPTLTPREGGSWAPFAAVMTVFQADPGTKPTSHPIYEGHSGPVRRALRRSAVAALPMAAVGRTHAGGDGRRTAHEYAGAGGVVRAISGPRFFARLGGSRRGGACWVVPPARVRDAQAKNTDWVRQVVRSRRLSSGSVYRRGGGCGFPQGYPSVFRRGGGAFRVAPESPRNAACQRKTYLFDPPLPSLR